MPDHPHPLEVYRSNITALSATLKTLSARNTLLGWMRLLCLLAAFLSLWLLWPFGLPAALGAFGLLFGLFLRIVSLDLKNKSVIRNTKLLSAINEQEITILHHAFESFPDGGGSLPPTHAYASDLDILGPASLFQYINRTISDNGNATFASWLLSPPPVQTILLRQEAVKELRSLTAWRQQLQACGIARPIKHTTETRVKEWLSQPGRFYGRRGWEFARFLLPAAALTVLTLHIAGILSAAAFYPLTLIFMAAAFAITRKVVPLYNQLNTVTSELEVLSGSSAMIEKYPFRSALLQELREKFRPGNTSASVIITRLNRILNRMDYRYNLLLFLPLNTFLCWDLQLIFQLERWKLHHGKVVEQWFGALGEMESLSSLATLSFNHPSWCFPAFTREAGMFSAEKLGHPLIPPAKMVPNDFHTSGPGHIALITGSNMAGKSTFLRSVGVNIVLAMMGSPVCASALTLSPVKVISSMRVTDNLNESTSTFYAELKKLKFIIAEAGRHEPVFLLLDEILRGTNSLDRHTGSKALIRQLLKQGAVGMVATHDIELSNLAFGHPGRITNYHFDVQVEGEELFFDYQLKEGVCRSMNASILMKKIGIELDPPLTPE